MFTSESIVSSRSKICAVVYKSKVGAVNNFIVHGRVVILILRSILIWFSEI